MLRFVSVFACVLLAVAPATADNREGTNVLGGRDAGIDELPDIVGVGFRNSGRVEIECTGTLIAPTVVLSAAHCDASNLVSVLIGSHDLDANGVGESIAVIKRIPYPNADQTSDSLLLVLASPSTKAPRPLATGWARLDLVNGATASFAGYGAIDRDATQLVSKLQIGQSTVTDADCRESSGCNPGIAPAGELGAGGKGIDTCPGDSGGPLYLETSYGRFLAGVTSRGYDNNQFACSEGGIYARPDKILSWIEQQVGPVQRGPEPKLPALAVAGGEAIEGKVIANDPVSDQHDYTVVREPARSRVAVRGDGQVRVCADGAEAGADSFDLAITDRKAPTRTLFVTVPIEITAGTNATDCSLEFDEGGCGCEAANGRSGVPIGVALLTPLALAFARRRQSRYPSSDE